MSAGITVARAKHGDLSYLPQPGGRVASSPFAVNTTAQTIGPFSGGAIMVTCITNNMHFRMFRAGETVVSATTGDMQIPIVASGGPFVIPTKKDDVMSIRSVALGAGTVQISSVRED